MNRDVCVVTVVRAIGMGPRMVEPEFSFRGRMNSFVFGKDVMGFV
jgi:hypothetical protein